MSDKLKKIPSGSKKWMTIRIDGDTYTLISDLNRIKYTLLKELEDGYEKIGVSDNPSELENKYIWKKKK